VLSLDNIFKSLFDFLFYFKEHFIAQLSIVQCCFYFYILWNGSTSCRDFFGHFFTCHR